MSAGWRLDIFREIVTRQEPRLPYSALKGQQTLAQGRVRSRNSARRPACRSPRVSPSPPRPPLLGGLGGEGWGEGGRPCPFAKITLRAERHLENNETRDSSHWQRTAPLSQPLPPNPWERSHPGCKKQARCLRSQGFGEGFGGRGENGWNADPGRREGLLPLAGPGLFSVALYRAFEGSSGVLPLLI